MSTGNVIKTFTAIDIEKYHRGLLSPAEMHDMEKASLDDPFLADALEGYAIPGVNTAADITDLKTRLADRLAEEEGKKIIPLAANKSSINWWKIAALFVLLIGAGIFVYRTTFMDTKTPVAKLEDKQNKEAAATITDSIHPADANKQATLSVGDSNTRLQAWNAHTGKAGDSLFVNLNTQSSGLFKDTTGKLNYTSSTNADGVDDKMDDKQVATIPAEEKATLKEVEVIPNRSNEYKKTESSAVTANGYTNYPHDMRADSTAYRKQKDNNSSYTVSNDLNYQFKNQNNLSAKQNNQLVNRRNIFRGSVTDNNNNAVPFANITNVLDNVGTYTDAKGNFVLTSTDSVLNVQVKSIGFENNITQLQPQATPSQVIMQEDRSSLAEVVISHKKITSTRSRTSNMVLEEPEPVDGWDNYDTYVANNLNVPETFKSKQSANSTSEVQLSFTINKDGEPVNITVDKSLCDSCDKEAIRIIKEGPKWKSKKKKGRTSVTISF